MIVCLIAPTFSVMLYCLICATNSPPKQEPKRVVRVAEKAVEDEAVLADKFEGSTAAESRDKPNENVAEPT